MAHFGRLPMISSHIPPFAQIHIPRTGGTAWSLALCRRIPDSTLELHHRKHTIWRQVVRNMGIQADWTGLVWCVVRPPHEIVESWWCNVATWWRDTGQHHPKFAGPYTLDWLQYCARLKLMGFERWFDEIVATGNFDQIASVRSHWLRGIDEYPGVKLVIYRFGRLAAAWRDVCGRLGVDADPMPDGAARVDDRLRPSLTSEQRKIVERICADDYREFWS